MYYVYEIITKIVCRSLLATLAITIEKNIATSFTDKDRTVLLNVINLKKRKIVAL